MRLRGVLVAVMSCVLSWGAAAQTPDTLKLDKFVVGASNLGLHFEYLRESGITFVSDLDFYRHPMIGFSAWEERSWYHSAAMIGARFYTENPQDYTGMFIDVQYVYLTSGGVVAIPTPVFNAAGTDVEYLYPEISWNIKQLTALINIGYKYEINKVSLTLSSGVVPRPNKQRIASVNVIENGDEDWINESFVRYLAGWMDAGVMPGYLRLNVGINVHL